LTPITQCRLTVNLHAEETRLQDHAEDDHHNDLGHAARRNRAVDLIISPAVELNLAAQTQADHVDDAVEAAAVAEDDPEVVQDAGKKPVVSKPNCWLSRNFVFANLRLTAKMLRVRELKKDLNNEPPAI